MSSFGGRMKEYERISLDRFDGKNLQSTVYFLSHLHEDHTVGLATPVFFKHLKTSKNVFLYCSEVTEVLIKASKKYRHLLPYIKKIAINTPTTIEIPDPLFDEIETVTITFLPAFHCPGSVMCLFEGHEGTVLYTGDFRWEHFHIEQMYHLRSGENVKKVKSLYVDTTFCTPENLYIPSRQHCIDATYQLVYEWISQSPQHVVYMSLRAQYGHEPLLNAVASRLNKKHCIDATYQLVYEWISVVYMSLRAQYGHEPLLNALASRLNKMVHVDSHKVEVYDQIHEFHGNFTSDGSATQIHACGKEMQNIDGEHIPCRHQHDPDKVLVILPTTMYFTQFQHLTLDKIVRKVGDTFYRVCYSFHSSYTELKDLISYLKPETIYPNVKPPNDASLAVVQHRLNTMLAECMQSEGAGDIESEVKQLGALKTRSSKRVAGKRKQSTPSDTESLDFGTPTKVQKIDIEPKKQARGRGRKSAPESSQESEADLTPSRGRGRGRQTRSSQNVAADTPKRASTRLRSRQAAESEVSRQKTPVKKQGSESPDMFLTPSKSEMSEKQSSYAGSHGDESEMDLTLSQKSLDLESSLEVREDNIDAWTGGSFLTAVSSHDEVDACVYLYEDVEQTDGNFEDVSQIEGDKEEEALSLEDVEKMETNETPIRASPKKTPAKKGRKSKGKAAKKSNQKAKPTEDSELNVTDENLDKSVETNTEKVDNSKEETITKQITVTESVENGRKSKGKAAKRSNQKVKSELNVTDVNFDKSVENMENYTENLDHSKKETVNKEMDKSVESLEKNTENVDNSKNKTKSVSETSENMIECDTKSGTENELEVKSSKTEASTVENKSKKEHAIDRLKHSDNSMDKDASKENSEDSDIVIVPPKEVSETEVKIQGVYEKEGQFPTDSENAPAMQHSNNSMDKDAIESKQNFEDSDIVIVSPNEESETEAKIQDICEIKGQLLSDSSTTPDIHDDVMETEGIYIDNEDISKAIMESMGSEIDMIEDGNLQAVSECVSSVEDERYKERDNENDSIQGIRQNVLSEENEVKLTSNKENNKIEDTKRNPVNDDHQTSVKLETQSVENEIHQESKNVSISDIKSEENQYHQSGDNESDSDNSDDIIEDTPPSERSVLGSHLNTSVIFSVNEIRSERQYYTRHWPLPPGLSKQEKRRNRKRKQKKKKYAALHGTIYYDSDVEIIVKDEPKVEIDLTARKEYDENDFEYDMDRKRKNARKESGEPPDDQFITVFKTEKVDDHLYGGSESWDVYKKEKRVQRLKYTRRNSFNFNGETPEDTEFIAELEAASAKKGVQPDTETTTDVEPKPLEDEYEKFMDEVAGFEAETDENSDKKNETEKSDNDSAANDTLSNTGKGEVEQMQDENANAEGEEELEKSNKTGKSKIQYTETKEGKKLMRISLSGTRKPGLMSRQNDLRSEIFIDLSNEDDADDTSEKKQTSITEKSAADNNSKVTDLDNSVKVTASKPDNQMKTISNHESKVNSESSEMHKNKDEKLITDKRKNNSHDNIPDKDRKSKKIKDTNEIKLERTDSSSRQEKKQSSDVKITENNDKLDKNNEDHTEYWEDGSCIVYVGDDENSDESSHSGEWLSCSKAMKDKQQSSKSSKKGKQKRKARKRPDTQTSSKRLNVEKEPVENVIDKYVKHFSSSENIPLIGESLNESNEPSSERNAELDAHDLKKRERVKQKALEAMFDMDFESYDKIEKGDSVPEISPVDDLYEETISLSSDSEIESDSNKKDKQAEKGESIVSPARKAEAFGRNKHSVCETVDRAQTKKKGGRKEKWAVSNHRDSGVVNRNIHSDRNKHSASEIVDDKVGKRTSNQEEILEAVPMEIDESTEKNVPVVSYRVSNRTGNTLVNHNSNKKAAKSKKKQQSRWFSSATETGSAAKVSSASQVQTTVMNTTQINLPHTPGFPAQSATFIPPPPPFNVPPPPIFNMPPPSTNAAVPNLAAASKLGAAPKFTIPPPILTIPARASGIPPMPYGGYSSPFIKNSSSVPSSVAAPSHFSSTLPFTRFPPPLLANSSSVANPSVTASNFTASVPFVRSSMPANAGSLSTHKSSSSALPDSTMSRCSFQPAQSSQSRSDSASSFLASLPGTDSQSLLSSVSLPSTVIGTLNKVLDVILNTKPTTEASKATSTTQSGVGLSSASEIISKLDKSQWSSQDQSDLEARGSDIGSYKPDDPRSRVHDYNARSRYDRDDSELRKRADEHDPYRHEDIRYRRGRDRSWSGDDPRYDPEVRRQNDDVDSDRLRRLDSDRPISPYRNRPVSPYDDRPLSPFSRYERERAKMYERERAREEFYRDLEADRRRQEYDRYYEEDYYRRRRESDPYYDYPPPRSWERPYDPYYDEPWRSSREYNDRPRSPLDYNDPRRPRGYEAPQHPLRDPYGPNPRDDPYYHPHTEKYDDTYEERPAGPRRRDTLGNIAPSRQSDEPPSLLNVPVKPSVKIPSLLNVQTGSGKTATEQTKNPQRQNVLLTQQITAQNAGRFVQNRSMQSQRPTKTQTPIVVTRGKRVESATKGMIEKVQASFNVAGSTAGKPELDSGDSERPAFCTGLNPKSMDRTGYAYRQQSRRNYYDTK